LRPERTATLRKFAASADLTAGSAHGTEFAKLGTVPAPQVVPGALSTVGPKPDHVRNSHFVPAQ